MAQDTPVAASEQLLRDAFFVPERRARARTLQALLADTKRELAAWEASHSVRERQRKRSDQAKHEQMVEAILCNALHCHLRSPHAAVAVSLGRERGSRYEPPPYAPCGPC